MIMPCTPNSYAAGVFDLVSWAERIFLNEKICFLMKLRRKKEKKTFHRTCLHPKLLKIIPHVSMKT